MSIPYHSNLSLKTFQTNPNWHENMEAPKSTNTNQISRAAEELSILAFKGPFRSIQFVRDAARLALKTPIRAIAKPIFLKKNWAEWERAAVNAKLVRYAFIQLVSVPVKFMVALTALGISKEKAHRLLDKSDEWTAHLDGRASQLEALKEEGAKKAKDREEFDEYRVWLYGIDPKLCRQMN